MAAKSNKKEKAKTSTKKAVKEKPLHPGEPDFAALAAALPTEPQVPTDLKDVADALAVTPPTQLTLPLLTDSGTLFVQGVQQLTAQLLGQPESAPLLVSINGWIKGLETAKKLIVGDDDKVEGLKAKVISDGVPWGEKGSKQLTMAGAVVKVKAVNYRAPDAPLTINDLDPAKVEAYLRGVPWTQPIEKVLACYMKPVTTWTLKDLPPQQQTNLAKMLADPGEDGQGLRQCLRETKYQMMAPEMENA